MSFKYNKINSALLTIVLVITTSVINCTPVSAKTNIKLARQKAYHNLSRFGITKSEVADFSDEELDEFANSSEIVVSTKYYKVTEDAVKEVSSEECTEAVNKEKKDNNSIMLLSTSSASDEEKSSGGYLKQRVYISKAVGSSSKYYVSYEAKWLKDPQWQNVDVFGVAVGNATLCKQNPYVSYTYTYKEFASQYTHNLTESRKDKLSPSTFSSGVGAKVDLHTPLNKYYQYTNRAMTMTFYVTKSQTSVKNISVAGYYKHEQSVISVSPSISGVSISAGLSISKSSYYVDMNPNPYAVLYF